MTQTIRLHGIRTEGRHGASRGEQDSPQAFVIDLEIEVEALADDLGTTADYRVVTAAVQDLISKRSFNLLETIAERVAEHVAAIPGVRWCRATAHKPRAAARLAIDDVTASAEAGRR